MASFRPLALVPLLLLAASGVARADDDDDPPPPPPPYGAPGAPQPVYLAPLSQQTQSTYVPQSVALSGPEELEAWSDAQSAPAGYTPMYRKRKHLIVGGAVTLGVTWSLCAMAAAIGDDTSSDGDNRVAALWIPVLGPFIEMGETNSSSGKFLLASLGGAQLAGALMLYFGITAEQRVFVRNDLISHLTVSPMAGNGASGMMVSGHF